MEPNEFLAYLIERIFNITICQQEMTRDDCGFDNILDTKDVVLPTVVELKGCLKKNLMSEKDTVLYKLLIQYYLLSSTESNTKLSRRKKTVKCALKFYKKISQAKLSQSREEIATLGYKIK